MAAIKISKVTYKDLKKEDNEQLATIFGGKSIVSKNTGFEDKPLYCLSLQTHRRNLSITEDPETIDNPIRIDGAHRYLAAKEAGIEKNTSIFNRNKKKKLTNDIFEEM